MDPVQFIGSTVASTYARPVDVVDASAKSGSQLGRPCTIDGNALNGVVGSIARSE